MGLGLKEGMIDPMLFNNFSLELLHLLVFWFKYGMSSLKRFNDCPKNFTKQGLDYDVDKNLYTN
jgi:hypothetical protein